jgi:flagellar motility protein MotE (MotC chaperone)
MLICGWFVLGDGAAVSVQAEPRVAAGPLDIVSVARSPSAPRRPAAKQRRKKDVRLPPAAPAAAPATTPVAPAPATAEKADDEDVTGAVGGKRAGKKAALPANANDGTQFCTNIADAASDARLAWQMKELEKVEATLRERIAELEAKRAEYEKWLKLRQDFLKKAEDNMVGIYTRMRPDAAAAQIASMQDDTAAAVLAKLNTRSSSAILNEMEPARAAHLANTLSGMRQTDGEKAAK